MCPFSETVTIVTHGMAAFEAKTAALEDVGAELAHSADEISQLLDCVT